MELEDFKSAWNETKSPVQEHQTFDPENLKKIMDQNYRSKMKRIMIPEIMGSIVCLAAAIYIGLRFHNLDTYLLQAAGLVSVLLLLALPVISTLSTWKMDKVGDLTKPYASTLKSFAVQKIRFFKLQKLNVTLSYLLLVNLIVLLSKLFSGKDLSSSKYYWLFSFTIGFIFLLFYSRWVEKFYRRSLREAEDLIQELPA